MRYTKKLVTLLLSLAILLSLSGCSKIKAGNGISKQTGPAGEPLVIYCPAYSGGGAEGRIFLTASRIFTENYGIEVELYPAPTMLEKDDSSYLNHQIKLAADIMTGHGPDIFILLANWSNIDDFMKKIHSKAFCDLNKYIESDTDFSLEHYNQVIMDAGVFEGCRYIIPLSYIVPLLFASQTDLTEQGFSADDFSSYEKFLSDWENLNDKGITLLDGIYSINMLSHVGWFDECLDFENGTVDLELDSFRRLAELMANERRIMERDKSPTIFGTGDSQSDNDENQTMQRGGLFYLTLYLSGYEFWVINNQQPGELNAVFPVPNAFGRITGYMNDYCLVSESCKNKDAAWSFIKIMLSEEVQNSWYDSALSLGAPVRKGDIDKYIDDINRFQGFNTESMDSVLKERIKAEQLKIYNSCDNAVIPNLKGMLLFEQMADYIFDGQLNEFEKVKTKAANYFRIYLSE